MIRRPPRSTRTEHSFPTRRSSDLAGMGIGLMFYGVAEPMSHYSAAMGGVTLDASGARTDWAPLGGAAGDVKASADLAMAATIFHWGLHPWAIYAIVEIGRAHV